MADTEILLEVVEEAQRRGTHEPEFRMRMNTALVMTNEAALDATGTPLTKRERTAVLMGITIALVLAERDPDTGAKPDGP